jgi:hemerythrin-like domain-containing protein
MDALTLVRQDHRRLEGLLERFEQHEGTNVRERSVLLRQLRDALRHHVGQEERFLYPIFRQRATAEEIDLGPLDRAIEQHRLIELLADELADLDQTDEALPAKMRVLTELVRNHLDTEDAVVLPAIEDLIDDDTLLELGHRMEQRQEVLAAQQELVATMTPGGVRGRRLAAAVGGVVAAAGAALLAVLARRRRPPPRRRTAGWRRTTGRSRTRRR